MRTKLREMRHNERILIAVDVLLQSKSSFMSVFLMAFMMKVSLSDSPRDFIVYCLVRYAIMGIIAVLLIPFFKKHPLVAWRSSMIFSILEITTIILFSSWPGFIYVIALFSALESTLYWRPKIIFDTQEVSDENRVNFKSTGQICLEIVKIVMPIVLGFAIDANGYQNAAIFILIISTAQLVLSLFFHPHHAAVQKHKLMSSVKHLFAHESLQRILWMQLLRGLLTASAAYIVVATISLNRATVDNTQRGFVTAIASVAAIIVLLIYRKLAKSPRHQKMVLVSLAPAVILVPLIVFLFPNDPIICFAFYTFTTAVLASLIDSTVSVVRIQDILSRHAKNDDDRVAIEALGEMALSVGRVISLGILLLVVIFADYRHELILAIITAFLVLPLISILISAKALAKDK